MHREVSLLLLVGERFYSAALRQRASSACASAISGIASRKAFQRWRGLGGATGRLVELRQRKRRAQADATRALLIRDRDGGQEGLFRISDTPVKSWSSAESCASGWIARERVADVGDMVEELERVDER